MKRVHVAAAVIRRADGHILLAKRADQQHQGGLWEFPGGKVELGETHAEALLRQAGVALDKAIISTALLNLGGIAGRVVVCDRIAGNVFVDLRNIYPRDQAEKAGFLYFGVGR